ncbi:MAG: hypothetical protein GQ540_03380 [Lutibacter sp.]|nr:hypothetical protein [Lutibacter sp.]
MYRILKLSEAVEILASYTDNTIPEVIKSLKSVISNEESKQILKYHRDDLDL